MILTSRPLFNTPLFNVLCWSMVWAIQILVSRMAFVEGLSLGGYITQTSIGTFSLSLLFLLPKVKDEAKLLLRNHPKILNRIFFANFIHSGIAGVFYFTSLALTSATNVGFLSKLSIVSTLVFAHFFLNERLSKFKVANLLLMFTGAYLLIVYGKEVSIEPGALLIIIACLFWSTGNVLVKSQMQKTKISGELIAAFRPILGAPTLIILAAIIPLIFPSLKSHFGSNYLDPAIIPYSLANAFLTMGVAIFLYRTLSVASASYASMMSMTNPVIVAFLGYNILGETLTPIQLVGSVLIIFGGILSQAFKKN